MAGIRSYSTTASSNNAAPPNGMPENQPASTVNDTVRQIMADIRTGYEDQGWIDYGDTPTRVDNDTFTVTGNLTTRYQVGRRFRLTGDTTGYGTISASAFGAVTTVDVVMDSGNVPLNLTMVALSSGSETGGLEAYFKRTGREVTESVSPIDYRFRELNSPRYSTLDNLISVLGSTDSLRGGIAQIANGAAFERTATLTIDRKTGWIHGEGPGSSTAGSGTVLQWTGAAGSPMIEVKRCWGLTFGHFRLMGKSTAKPSAGIKFTSTALDAPFNTALCLENFWIGSYSGFDADNTFQFTDGIVVGGTNQQGDQSRICHGTIQGCVESCIDFTQSQNVFWRLDTLTLNSAKYGVRIATEHINCSNIFCQTLTDADWYMPTDGIVNVIGYGSELGGRMFKADDGFQATFESFYFQLSTDSVTASGRVIEAITTTHGSLTLRNGSLDVPAYAGPAPKIYMRGPNISLIIENVFLPAAIDSCLDIVTVNAGDKRRVRLHNVVDTTGAVFNGDYFWKHGDLMPVFSTEALGQQQRTIFVGSASWDIGNTANGANAQTNVTVTGVRLGDAVDSVDTSTGLSGWNFTGKVTATDTVRVTGVNNTGGNDDPASMTVYVTAKQRHS